MRHPCKDCGLTYRNPLDLEEHKRVGCRVQSAKGESLIAEEPEEEAPELNQEVSLEPEPQEEKESSQWQEPMST
jgi:hypothetical protein